MTSKPKQQASNQNSRYTASVVIIIVLRRQLLVSQLRELVLVLCVDAFSIKVPNLQTQLDRNPGKDRDWYAPKRQDISGGMRCERPRRAPPARENARGIQSMRRVQRSTPPSPAFSAREAIRR